MHAAASLAPIGRRRDVVGMDEHFRLLCPPFLHADVSFVCVRARARVCVCVCVGGG